MHILAAMSLPRYSRIMLIREAPFFFPLSFACREERKIPVWSRAIRSPFTFLGEIGIGHVFFPSAAPDLPEAFLFSSFLSALRRQRREPPQLPAPRLFPPQMMEHDRVFPIAIENGDFPLFFSFPLFRGSPHLLSIFILLRFFFSFEIEEGLCH